MSRSDVATWRLSVLWPILLMVMSLLSGPATAMVGNAPAADPSIARHLVLLVSSRGSVCTGVAIARDLILTAAHCAAPEAEYKFVTFDKSGNAKLNDIALTQRHPQFDLKAFTNHRATADVALMKTAQPLPAVFAPARMGAPQTPFKVGQRLPDKALPFQETAVAAARRARPRSPSPASLVRYKSGWSTRPPIIRCRASAAAPATPAPLLLTAPAALLS